jgi:hypothetical protein
VTAVLAGVLVAELLFPAVFFTVELTFVTGFSPPQAKAKTANITKPKRRIFINPALKNYLT